MGNDFRLFQPPRRSIQHAQNRHGVISHAPQPTPSSYSPTNNYVSANTNHRLRAPRRVQGLLAWHNHRRRPVQARKGPLSFIHRALLPIRAPRKPSTSCERAARYPPHQHRAALPQRRCQRLARLAIQPRGQLARPPRRNSRPPLRQQIPARSVFQSRCDLLALCPVVSH